MSDSLITVAYFLCFEAFKLVFGSLRYPKYMKRLTQVSGILLLIELPLRLSSLAFVLVIVIVTC
jgi:hypothetical protein